MLFQEHDGFGKGIFRRGGVVSGLFGIHEGMVRAGINQVFGQRRGVEMRIILNCKDELPRKVDAALPKGIARARQWFEEVASGRVPSLAETARRERLRNAMWRG